MITPLLPQLPPRPARAVASTCDVPPEIAIFCSFPFAKNADVGAVRRPERKTCALRSRQRRNVRRSDTLHKEHGQRRYFSSGDTNTSMDPSLDSAMWLMLISSGTARANCIRVVGTGRRATNQVTAATATRASPIASQRSAVFAEARRRQHAR